MWDRSTAIPQQLRGIAAPPQPREDHPDPACRAADGMTNSACFAQHNMEF